MQDRIWLARHTSNVERHKETHEIMVARQQVLIDPNDYGNPKSPPLDKYVLEFLRVDGYGLSKPFGNEEPKNQFTLIFRLEVPKEDEEDLDPDDRCNGMEIKAWYTPKFRAIPGRQVPKLFTLLEALNGGTYEQPTGPYDAWEELERFAAETQIDSGQDATGKQVRPARWERQGAGTRFRCDVGPNESGWPRLQGDPSPLRERRAPRPTGRVVDIPDGFTEDGTDQRF